MFYISNIHLPINHLTLFWLLQKRLKRRMEEALVYAAAEGDASRVTQLLLQGAKVDARYQGFTPLMVAVQYGHTEVCQLLLEKGRAKIEEAMPGGATALIVAANKGEQAFVKGSKGGRKRSGLYTIADCCTIWPQ